MKEFSDTKGRVLPILEGWVAASLSRLKSLKLAEALSVAAVFGIGIALRLLFLDSESLWFDTVHSIALADHHDPAGVVMGAFLDMQSPLYFLLLHWWLPVSASDFWVRLLSVVFGVATLVMVYLVAKALFSKETALLASLLAALSSYQVYFSRYPRGYILLAFLSLVSLYFLYFAITRKGVRYWVAYSIATALALYTHPYAFFLLAAEGTFTVTFAFRSDVSILRPWGVSQLMIFASFFPWLGATFSQWAREQGGADIWMEEVSPASLKMLYDWLWFKTRGEYSPFWDVFLRIDRYILMALFGLGLLKRGKTGEKSFLIIALAVPIGLAYGLAATISPVWDPRYFPFVSSPFYILVAYAIVTIRIRIKSFEVPVKALSYLLIIGIAIPPLLSLYFDPKFHSPDVRGTAQWLRSQYIEGDVIVHLNYQSYLTSLWYNRQSSEAQAQSGFRYRVPCIWGSLPDDWCQDAPYNETYLNTAYSTLPEIAQGAKRVWLVALYNHVWPREDEITDARVEEVVGDAYRELERRQFLGVTVCLLSPSTPAQ